MISAVPSLNRTVFLVLVVHTFPVIIFRVVSVHYSRIIHDFRSP